MEFDLGQVVGADGKGIVSIELISTSGKNKTYRITYTDESYFDYVVKDGDDAISAIVTSWEQTLSDSKVPSEKLTKDTLDTKVDKVTGKGLSTEDYTTVEKSKLAGIEAEANKTVVDSSLSSTSENPVQNKVVKGSLDLKANSADLATVATTGDYDDLTNKLEVVDELTSTDTGNPLSAKQGKILNDTKVDKVTGKGLSTEDYTTAEKTKLAGVEAEANKTMVDSSLSDSSTNPLQNKIVKSALDNKVNSTDLATVATTGDYDDLTNKPVIPPGVIVDQTLDGSSTDAVANQAVVGGLNGKSDTNHTHSNWQEVYNNKNLVIQYNSVIGLYHAVFSLEYNFTNNNFINYITNIPSPYRPPANMVCFGHPAGTVHIALNATGVLQFKRLTGTGLTSVSGVWVYIRQ